jgi:hypothetical protein
MRMLNRSPYKSLAAQLKAAANADNFEALMAAALSAYPGDDMPALKAVANAIVQRTKDPRKRRYAPSLTSLSVVVVASLLSFVGQV